ncbi:hypothetical protein [Bradyrhizobium sp. BR 1433]|uniref:hypothetical protein n=1 Tax=Bradyrhizobium sp. BR 1433 TaxID=3447967 RepID=UPI003EE6C20E
MAWISAILAAATQLQSAEIDRRPQQPRQLAGEYGSSEDGEESVGAGGLTVDWFFDADADAVRSCKSLDDPVNVDRPVADVAFKPKCLGIASSIQIHVAHAVRRPQVQSEHVVAIQSKRFAWLLTSTERAVLFRSSTDASDQQAAPTGARNAMAYAVADRPLTGGQETAPDHARSLAGIVGSFP